MKELLTMTIAASLALSMSVAPAPEPEPYEDIMAIMISAVVAGDTAAGIDAGRRRSEKIAEQGLDNVDIDFNELNLLSKIMYAEAGSYWLSDEIKLGVGEVVLNRVASPEFPDTMLEVLEQPGQYYGKNSWYFNNIRPDERCVKLALRLLEGERNFESSVVFQANFRQGSGVHASFFDQHLGWTYFCYSSRPELYYEA